MQQQERFWTKVVKGTPDQCWNWKDRLDRDGYGSFFTGTRRNPKTLKAHRYSYALHNGPIPDGLFVLHNCDNAACVNPDHLRLGTAADNMSDVMARNRHRGGGVRGSAHPNSLVNESQAAEICRIYAAGGISQTKLGKQFGVSQQTVSAILTNVNWKHVTKT